jgi:hypothetical protein
VGPSTLSSVIASSKSALPRQINLWLLGAGRLGIDSVKRALRPATVVERGRSSKVKRLGRDGQSTCKVMLRGTASNGALG